MELALFNKVISRGIKMTKTVKEIHNLSQGEMNTSYHIKEIATNDPEVENFLFTLGCYEGEEVTIISRLADNYVISVKDARYSIDSDLAKAIRI